MGFGSDKTGFYKPSAVTVTASGNPLTLQNAKRLRKLTIYGNAVQDGTPSPDAPVEVQLCGDRTGNLFDVSNFTSNSNGYVENGSIYVTGYPYQPGITPEDFLEMTGLKEGDTFTSVADYTQVLPASNKTQTVQFIKKESAPEDISTLVAFGIEGAIITRIIPAGFNSDNFYPMYIYCGTSTGKGVKAIWRNLAIYKGSYTADTLPAYEPYGYKVPVKVGGINLFDISKYTYANGNAISTSNSTGASWSGRFIDIDYAIELGKTYTLVCDYLVENASDTSTIRFGYATDRGMMAFTNGIKTVHGKGSIVFSVTVPESIDNYNNFSLYINSSMDDTPTIGDKMTISNIMIVQGSYTAETMPPYEPYQPPQEFAVYLPEQIAKVGDVADEVVVDMEKRTAEIRKNIIQDTFTGDDGWYTNREPTDTQDYFVANLTSKKVNGALSSLSSHFVSTTANILALNEAKVQSFVNGTAWYGACVDSAVYPDIASFKQFVTEQYSKGNPLTVYHEIEPVTTDITSLQQWDAMPQVSGTVTLTLSAEVDPSGAEAVYTATKRPKPQAALIVENTITEEPAETQVSDADINTEIIMMED